MHVVHTVVAESSMIAIVRGFADRRVMCLYLHDQLWSHCRLHLYHLPFMPNHYNDSQPLPFTAWLSSYFSVLACPPVNMFEILNQILTSVKHGFSFLGCFYILGRRLSSLRSQRFSSQQFCTK